MLTFALTASSKLEIIQRDLDSFASISCSHIFKPCTTKRVDISFESHSSIHHAPHNELTSRQLYLCHLEEHHRRYMFIPQTTQPIVSFKGVLLCFFTFICLLLYVCLGIKKIYKGTNLKVHSKGRYLVLKTSLFKNYSERLVWTTQLFSCICDITNFKSRLRKFKWLGGGRLVEHCTFQNRVFLYHCISDGNRLFSEHYGCHFHFILHVMSDKSAFVSGALFCVQRYRGNLDHYNSASRWQIINLHIYAATNSVTLWDYGINKFNCITVSLQFML